MKTVNEKLVPVAITFLTIGPGVEAYESEAGKFAVRYANGARDFENIIPAILFYYRLREEASLWDMNKQPILIESKLMLKG